MLILLADVVTSGAIPSMHHVFAWLGELAAALTAMAIIWRYAVRPVVGAVRRISAMYDRVEALVAQFERNGGSTIRDSLDRIELATSVQEQRQKIMLGLVPLAIAETDISGRVVFVNRTYLQWTVRQEEEILGDGWVNVIHPDDRERVRREWAEAVSEKRLYESKFRMVDNKMNCFYVDCHAMPIRSPAEDQNPYGWFAVIARQGNGSFKVLE